MSELLYLYRSLRHKDYILALEFRREYGDCKTHHIPNTHIIRDNRGRHHKVCTQCIQVLQGYAAYDLERAMQVHHYMYWLISPDVARHACGIIRRVYHAPKIISHLTHN